MPPTNPFPHLPLLLRYQGDAYIPGGGKESAQTQANKANSASHSRSLQGKANSIITSWQAAQNQRQQDGLPVLAPGMPLLLKIDTNLDLDDLRKKFSFEVVSEQDDGFVIVASENLELAAFLEMAQEFSTRAHGSGAIASIHELFDDPTQEERLKRILSETLFQRWPAISDTQLYMVEVGIACAGTAEIPNPPNEPERSERDTDARWAARQAEYARKHADWAQARSNAYIAWDEIKIAREQEVHRYIVESYQGEILDNRDGAPAHAVDLPDSFTVRIQVNGNGLRDFILNYPYIFEVVEPENIELPQDIADATARARAAITLTAPEASAPAVCVIDSGIQEEHYLLEPAIDKDTSYCFLPGISPTDVGDFVRPAGHGTRVAGAVLYADSIPANGQHQLPCWIQNARILDAERRLPDNLFPPAVLCDAIVRFHEGPRRTRLFNHSVNAAAPCRTQHMSAWAAEIDLLCSRLDILVIQSVGNLYRFDAGPFPGISQHLVAGRQYPAYLCVPSSRIANPAQSFQALSVGSVAYGVFENDGWKSFAPDRTHPSAFSRSGFGIWDSIKPEVVEFGGDNLRTNANPPDVATPAIGRACYPELVRSTMFPPGPAVDRDQVGTSFAAPKVTHIAAHLQAILPDEPCLLFRCLIVQSARWPEWTQPIIEELRTLKIALERLKRKKKSDELTQRITAAIARRTELEDRLTSLLRMIGYGIPDLERATSNSDHRTTFITSGATPIKASEGHIYQVPIPEAMRRPGDEYDILIEVTLSYVGRPRRTRRNLRRYLSTWVEWKSNGLDETPSRFRGRALKDYESGEEGDSNFGWTLGTHPGHGIIKNARRSSGTVQKDWAVKKSNSLPPSLCLAVVGHEGWSRDPDATAQYAMSVSFEILGKQIPIYELQRIALDELQTEIEAELTAEVQTEAEVDVPE